MGKEFVEARMNCTGEPRIREEVVEREVMRRVEKFASLLGNKQIQSIESESTIAFRASLE
jgi:hypothetical protein